ncbi:MAG: ribosome recycling factor [Candidatus Nealsonbacteria bacterium]|nr:ribosome recycling factor [Candidatus Nealsonbacteria bacterium]
MYKEIIKKIRPEMDKAVAFLEGEFSKIRTGRASPSLVEDIVVDCFGQKFPLRQLAAISSPEPKQVVIQPWDKSYVGGIEAALRESSLGVSPIVDKDVIRIILPPLTEEYRKNLVKILSEKKEDVYQTIRHFREKAWQEIQAGFKDGSIREDDKFRAKDELQKAVDEYNEKIDNICNKKEKDIME